MADVADDTLNADDNSDKDAVDVSDALGAEVLPLLHTPLNCLYSYFHGS